MPFILRIRSYQNEPPSTPVSKSFDALGGTIGRTPDNDLVLQDPSKSISRKHARIDFRNGSYYLTDTGSNPSMVNGVFVGPGSEAKLVHGDRITIGDYVIDVESDTVPASPFLPDFGAAGLGLQPSESSNTIALARIVGGGPQNSEGRQQGGDPLGIDLFSTHADALQRRGSESDHASPEIQAFPIPGNSAPVALAIPDDYDPLGDHASPHHVASHRGQAHYAAPAHAAPPAQGMAMTAPAAIGAVQDSEVIKALLKGMGLQGLEVRLPPAQLAELIGGMLREAVAGTMSVLTARAMTKRESRVDMTMMASQANNPLKFMADPQSALKQMLTNELPGYMSAMKAIGVAYDDLRSHELAVIAGMRAALDGVVQRFDPVEIEKQVKAGGMVDSVLGSNRKAKLWDRLTEVHADATRDMDDDFQRLFGDRFSAAYEEQVERLRAMRQRQT